jgi:hypothetical protein
MTKKRRHAFDFMPETKGAELWINQIEFEAGEQIMQI